MTKTRGRIRRQAAGARVVAAPMRLVPVARHGRTGLLRTTALQAVVLFGLAAIHPAQQAAAQPAPNARPQGGAVVGGSASIAQTPNATNVTQSTQRAALDWRSFDVGANQTVTFTAPSASSVTLNRVTGPDPSQIAGHIVANDQLVLVNQSGVIFSKGAQVDTAGLVVSASGIRADRFMQGSMTFDIAPRPGAKIENRGAITVRDRGLAALVAPQVANEGVITAKMGHVTLAGAEAHTVDLYGDGMVSINVTKQVTQASLDGKTVDALVTNTGVVRADGGTVTLTAQAVDGLVTTLVSAGGKLSADTAGGRAGRVLIEGAGGSVRVAGEVSAQGLAAGASGGEVEVNATQIAAVASGARIDVSGRAGGGTIAVGTTLARAHGGPSAAAPRTARGTLVEQGATLAADASGTSGAGGRITVLSTKATDFAGAITARGGAAGGSGGQAEVSGGAGFALTGSADLSAPHGPRGSLLLDPTNLNIVAGAGNLDGDSGLNGLTHTLGATTPDPATPPATVGAAKLAALGATSDLTLQASVDLTVTAPVAVGHGLTLQAGRDLTVTAGSSITATGALTLSAGTSSIEGFDFKGAITLNAQVSSGGLLTLTSGTNGVSAQAAVIGNTVSVFTSGLLTLGAASSISANAGAGTVDLHSAGVTQAAGSTISAGLLQSTGGIAGAASLAGTGNAIATLGNVSVTGGDFALADSSALKVAGTVQAATGNVRLSVGAGKVGQTVTFGDGLLTAGVLSAGPGKAVSVAAGAIVDAAGAGGTLSTGAGGAIEIAPFTAGASVSVGGASVADTATTPGTLGVPLGLKLIGSGATVRLGEAAGATTAKDIAFAAATDVTALGGLDLEGSGAVTQAAAASVKAAVLTGGAGSVDLGAAANAIGTLGSFATTGGFTISQAGPLVVAGAVSGANVSLAVTQLGGSITFGDGKTAGSATAAPGGAVTLQSDKLLLASAGEGSVTAKGGTLSIAPANAAAVVVGGPAPTVQLPTLDVGTVVIGKAGSTTTATSIQFAGAADFGAATLDVETAGAVSETASGSVAAGALTGSAGSIDLAAAAIKALGPLSANTGGIVLTDSDAFTVSGAVSGSGGDVRLSSTGGAITQSGGTVQANGTLAITASGALLFGGKLAATKVELTAQAGAVSESPSGGADTGVVQAGTLSVSATGGAVDLSTSSAGAPLNQVGTLLASSATGDFALADAAALQIVGTSGGANTSVVDSAAGGLTFGGLLTAGGLSAGAGKTVSVRADALSVFLTGTGTLAAPGGGTIEVATFSDDSITVGGAASAGTLAVALGALTLTTGSGGTLRLGEAAGVTTAQNIVFASGLDLTATGGALDLEAAGAVSQNAGAAIKAAALSGKAGSLDFTTEPGNAIATLGSFAAAAGGFSLTESGPLAVAGTVTGANIALTATKAGAAITLGNASAKGVLTAAAGGTVALRSDQLLLGAAGGSASAKGGTVAIAPFASGAVTVGGASATVALPALDAGTVVIGKAGAASTATTVAFAAASNFGAATLDVEASGAVTQTAAITAGALDGKAASFTLALTSNAIGAYGPLTATAGVLTLTDGQDLNVTGALSATGAVGLTAKAGGGTPGDVNLGGTVGGSSVGLQAAGAIVQTAGGVSAATLSAQAAGGQVKLNIGNEVGTLLASSATGDFALSNGKSLVVSGAVSGVNTSVTLAAGGVLTLGGQFVFLPGSLNAASGKSVSVIADGIALGTGGGSLNAPGGGTVAIAPATTGDDIAIGGASSAGTLGIALAGLSFDTGAGGTLRLGASAGGAPIANDISFVAATNFTAAVGTLDLEATGAVSQTAGSAVTVGRLVGKAASLDLTTEPTNAVATLGSFTAATGGFALTEAGPLAVAGTVSAKTVALSATSAGAAITLGDAAAQGVLTASAGGSVALRSDRLLLGAAGGSVSATGGTVAIAPFNARAVTLGGALATVQLPALDAATVVIGKAGGAVTATGVAFAAASNFGASALDIESSGAVTQTGAITAATVTGKAASFALGSASNAVGAFGPLTATGGALALTDGQDLDLAGALSATGAVTLTAKAGGGTPGDINLSQTVGGASIALSADGAIVQTAGGLSAASLSAQAGGGQVKLTVGNLIGSLAASSATGDFAFTDGKSLVVDGAVSGANVALTVSLAGGTLTLGDDSGGAGQITATAASPTVSLQADLMSLGTAGGNVTAAGGLVEIAPFTPGTDFGTAAAPLDLPSVTAATLRVGAIGGVTTAKNIVFGSPVSLGSGTLDLEASGDVSQLAGAPVTAGALTGTVGSLDFFSAGALNDITTIGPIVATTGSLAVGDLGSKSNLTIATSISATSVALSIGGSITQTGGTIHATAADGTVDLEAGGTLAIGGVVNAANVKLVSVKGDVTESVGAAAPTGIVQATLLTGSAKNGAALLNTPSPAGGGNQVAQLGAFSTSGALTLLDGRALAVADDVTGGVVTLTSSAALTQSAGKTITGTSAIDLSGATGIAFGGTLAAGTVSLAAASGDVTEALVAGSPTGVIQATLLTGSAPGGAALLNTASPAGAGNLVAGLGAFAAKGALTLLDGEALTATADISSGADLNLTANGGGITQNAATTILATGTVGLSASAGIAFGGTLHAAGVTLAAAGGDVTESLVAGSPTGVVQTASLTGSASGAALLDTASAAGAGNQVAQIGSFAAGAGLTLLDGEALTVGGKLSSAAGDVTLTVQGGALTQNAGLTISAPAGTIGLTASDGIAFGGALAANTVSLTAQAGDVTEALAGGSPTGSIQAGLLTGSAPGGAALLDTASPAGAGNQVARLGAFSTKGALTLLDGEALTVADAVSSGADVTLTTSGGSLTQDAATTVSAAGTIALSSSGGIAFGGTLHAATVSLAAQGGDVTESLVAGSPTGVIQAGLLTGSATAGAALLDTASPAGSGNQVAQLGTFTTLGQLALNDGEALTVVDTLTSLNGGVALNVEGGTLSQGAGLTILAPTGAVSLTATGTIAFAGTLAADSVSLASSGGDVTETVGAGAPSGVIQATTLTGSAPSGAALLNTASPAGAGNLVAQLGSFATKGALTLLDGRALTVAGDASSGADLNLTVDGGGITQDAATTIRAGGTIGLAASAGIAFGGTLHATGIVLTAKGGDVTESLVAGSPEGVLQTDALSGSASGAALLNTPSPAGAGNLVAALGAFATKGALTLLDGEALALTGAASSSAGDVTLATSAGAITQGAGATLSAPGAGSAISLASAAGIAFAGTLSTAGTLDLVAKGGDVSETGGTGVAQALLLTGSATGAASFATPSPSGAGNQVAQIGPFGAAGDLTLIDGRSLAVVGAAQSSGGGVALTVNGAAADLTVTSAVLAHDAATLSAGRAIAVAGTVQAGTSASLSAAGDVTQSGTVSAASVDETAGAGISQSAGTISASAGDVALTAKGGSVAQSAGASISDSSASGAIRLTASSGIAFGGTIATPGTVSLSAQGGDATETAAGAAAPSGVIVASLLTGSATGQALLDTPMGNKIDSLGLFTTGKDFTLIDGAALTVSGPLTASGGAVSLTDASDLAIDGAVSASTNAALAAGRDLTVAAKGSVAGAGVTETAVRAITHAGATTATAGSAVLTAGAGIAQPSGAITAKGGDVTLTAKGGSVAQSAGASISDPGAAATVSLSASAGISFGGTIATPGTVSLAAAAGDATETAAGATSPSGIVLAGLLTGSASGQGLFDTPSPAGAGNQIAKLGPFAATGGLTLLDGESLAVVGAVSSPAGAVSLTSSGDLAQSASITAASVSETAGGAISQTAGTIAATAGTLTLAAEGGSIAQSAGAVITDTAADGAISLSASAGIAFGGAVMTPGSVSLTAAGGDVTETAAGAAVPTGTIAAASLSGSASGSALLNTPSPAGGGNQVGTLAAFAVGQDFALLDGAALTVAGPLSAPAGAVSIGVDGAGLTLSGDVTASGSLALTSSGFIAQTSGTVQAGGPSLSLVAQGGSIAQSAGAVLAAPAAGAVASLTASTGVSLGGTVSTTGTISLVASGGDVTETGGVLDALTLTGSSTGAALLNTASPAGAGNLVAQLGAFSAGGDLTFADGETLALVGSQNAANATLTVAGSVSQNAGAALAALGTLDASASGGIAFAGTLSAPAAMLTALGGDIAEDPATGSARFGALSGSASGDVSLAAPAANAIGQVGSLAAGGALALIDGAALTIAGPVTAAGAASVTVQGAGNALVVNGQVTAGGDLALATGADLTQAGAVGGATVEETAGGSITHSGTSTATAGDATLTAGAGILQPGGAIAASAGNVTLTASGAGGIAFGGTLSAAQAVSLTAQAGDVTETAAGASAPSGIVVASTLTGSASGQALLTASAGNKVARLAKFTTGQDFALIDGAALTVSGPLTAGGKIALTDAGGLTVAGPVAASDAAALAAGGDLTVTAAGTVAGASVTETATGAITHAGATKSTAGSVALSAGAGIVQPSGAISASGGDVSLTASAGIAFGGTLNTAQTVSLVAKGGDVTESATGATAPSGIVLAGLLTGSASGAGLFTTASPAGGGNQIATLGPFSAGTGLTLLDGGSLSVVGAVSSSAGGVALTVSGSGSSLTVPASISAGGAVALSSGGGVGVSGTVTAGAAAVLTAAGDVTQSGTLSAASLSETAGGAISQSGGAVTATAGDLALTAQGGSIGQAAGASIADQSPSGLLSLAASGGIAFGGSVAAQGAASLTAAGGDISQTAAGAGAPSGTLAAATLTGSSSGAAVLNTAAGNKVAQLGAFKAGGAFVLLDGTGLTVSGPLSAQTIDVETPADITLAGGSITASRVADAGTYASLLRTFPTAAGTTSDIFFKAANLTQTGATAIDPGAAVRIDALAPQPTLRIDLTGSGAVQFADLQAPAVQLFLLLNNGTAGGSIDVAGLHVATAMVAGGATSLTGTVAGRQGTGAANVATLVPLRNGRYRINACPIGSVNCILLSPILVPITNPVQDVEVGNTNNKQDDPDLILPNVGEQDF